MAESATTTRGRRSGWDAVHQGATSTPMRIATWAGPRHRRSRPVAQPAGSTDRATEQVLPEQLDTGRNTRIVLALVRITLGALWIQGASWKVPPEFGQPSGSGLYRYTAYAVEHPVFPPYSWLVENLVLPHFTFFGYITLLTEASLGAFLLVGLATRFWAVVGLGQSLLIALSVLNAPNEWPWSYYLMIAGHLVLLATAAGRTVGLDGLLRPVWRRSAGRLPSS